MRPLKHVRLSAQSTGIAALLGSGAQLRLLNRKKRPYSPIMGSQIAAGTS
jgi:hypothetical protein